MRTGFLAIRQTSIKFLIIQFPVDNQSQKPVLRRPNGHIWPEALGRRKTKSKPALKEKFIHSS
jgi:hypothetical protein